MKKLITILIFTLSLAGYGQTTYTWTGADGDWSVTTNWTPNGTPTTADNVIFDNTSFTSADDTITIDLNAYCNDFTWSVTNFSVKINNDGNILEVHGSMYLTPDYINGSWVGGAKMEFKSTGAETITGNSGIYTFFSVWEFDGSGSWVFQDTGTYPGFRIYNGSVDINGQYVICAGIGIYSGTNDLDISSGRLKITGGKDWWNYKGSGFTFAASDTVEMETGSLFVNFSDPYTSFYDFIVTGNDDVKACLRLFSDLTVSNKFTAAGLNNTTRRLWIRTSKYGLQYSISAGSTNISNTDFIDVEGTGAANWNLASITGLSGDCGGNSGITFTPTETVYWYQNSANWSSVGNWFLDSNGAGGVGRVPLPQDTIIFDVNSFSTPSTITIDCMRAGDLTTYANIDQGVTLSNSYIYWRVYFGDTHYSDSITYNMTAVDMYWIGEGDSVIIDLYEKHVLDSNFRNGIFILESDFYCTEYASRGHTIANFNANSYDFTAEVWEWATDSAYTWMGTGIWTLNYNGYANRTFWDGASGQDPGSSTLYLDFSGSSDWLTTNAADWYDVEVIGSYTGKILWRAAQNMNTFTCNGGKFIGFYQGLTHTFVDDFLITGTSGNETIITAYSFGGLPPDYQDPTIQHTLIKTTSGSVYCDYVDVRYSNAPDWNLEEINLVNRATAFKINRKLYTASLKINRTEIYRWFARISTDSGNNTGWVITH